MRRFLLLSAALHAILAAPFVAAQPRARPEPERPARIEVIFGVTAAPRVSAAGASATGAVPDRIDPAGAEAVVSPVTAVTAVTAAAAAAAADAGLRVERQDPSMVAARDLAGNHGPDYPATAWRLRQQGTVLLRLYIGTDGAVTRVALSRSSGVAALDQAAIAALSTWRFLPAEQAGQPVASYRDQPVRFVLE